MSNQFAPDGKSRKSPARAMSDVLATLLLNSDAPEHFKIEVRIVEAWKSLDEKTMNLMKKCQSHCEEESEAKFDENREVLEYLTLMEVGLDSFLEAHPNLKEAASAE